MNKQSRIEWSLYRVSKAPPTEATSFLDNQILLQTKSGIKMSFLPSY